MKVAFPRITSAKGIDRKSPVKEYKTPKGSELVKKIMPEVRKKSLSPDRVTTWDGRKCCQKADAVPLLKFKSKNYDSDEGKKSAKKQKSKDKSAGKKRAHAEHVGLGEENQFKQKIKFKMNDDESQRINCHHKNESIHQANNENKLTNYQEISSRLDGKLRAALSSHGDITNEPHEFLNQSIPSKNSESNTFNGSNNNVMKPQNMKVIDQKGNISSNAQSIRDKDSRSHQHSVVDEQLLKELGTQQDAPYKSLEFAIKKLQDQNTELKKKVIKYKNQTEVIPELKCELQNVRDALEQMENSLRNGTHQDLSFGGARTNNSHQATPLDLARKDEKNYSLVKENIELKGQISELKEHIIKRNHVIEDSNSQIRIITTDLKYLHQKLNHGEQLSGTKDIEITPKFLVSLIDHHIDEKLLAFRDIYDANQILEERITGLKDQIVNHQVMNERNQDVAVQQQTKLAQIEDSNKNLRSEIGGRQDSDKLLEYFKQHVRTQLLNIQHQIDVISVDHKQQDPRRNSESHTQSIDQLFDYLSERVQSSCLNERNLRQLVDHLQLESQQMSKQLTLQQHDYDEKRSQIVKDEEEHRLKLQNHIRKLEDHLQKSQYDRSYNQIDIDVKLKAKEQQTQVLKCEINILEDFLGDAFKRIKVLNFQKSYLNDEAKQQFDTLLKLENELKRFLPIRELIHKKRSMKEVVQAIMFSIRIKKASQYQTGDPYLRKKALECLLDNQINNRKYWESSIKQNQQLFKFVENLNQKMINSSYLIRFADLPKNNASKDDRFAYVDTLKLRMGELENQNSQLQIRLNDFTWQVDSQDRRFMTYEQEMQVRETGSIKPYNSTTKPEELLIRQRGLIRELESKLEDQEHTYEQKIRYLKQEIEMKKHQIDNMKKLIEFREPIAGNSLPSVINLNTDLTKNQISTQPIRQYNGGAFQERPPTVNYL